MRLIDADALIAETMKNRCADCDRRKGIKQGKTTFVYDFGEAPCRACDVGDMIDTLDEATTISGWISVKDRMPEKDKDVLVWLYGDYCIGRYDQDPDNLQMRWKFEAFNLYEDDMSYITHWMPLPEPPEKEK